jgi:hypothetical protein
MIFEFTATMPALARAFLKVDFIFVFKTRLATRGVVKIYSAGIVLAIVGLAPVIFCT